MMWQRVFLVSLLCAIGTSCSNVSEESVEESKRRAERIAEKVREFRRDNGQYPEELSAITPDYLDEIPKPTVGGEGWNYGVARDGDFVIEFGDGPWWLYDSGTSDWRYDSGEF